MEGDADQDFLNLWADSFGLTFPVLGMGDIPDLLEDLGDAEVYGGSIPFVMVLDRDMRIVRQFTGVSSANEEALDQTIERLLED